MGSCTRIRELVCLLVGPTVALFVGRAAAERTYWNVPSGDWSVESNWTNGAPGMSTLAYINNGGTARVSQRDEVCEGLYVGNAPGESGTLEISTGSLSSWSEGIGTSGDGSVHQSGGSNWVYGGLYLGRKPGGTGAYRLEDGTLHTNETQIGIDHGSGTFVQTGGLHAAAHFTLGYGNVLGGAGGDGSYTLAGGRLVIDYALGVGRRGTATFDHSGGSVVARELSVRAQSGRANAYNLSDSGDLRVSSTTRVFTDAGAAASFNQTGGRNFADSFDIGGTGSASYNQAAGSATVNELLLANNGGETGTYNLGPAAELAATEVIIGRSGTGIFNQRGGEHLVHGGISLAQESNNRGTYSFTGGSLTFRSGPNRYLRVGQAGTGVFNFGDAAGTGTIDQDRASVSADLTVRDPVHSGASGTFQGWGSVELTGTLQNNGQAIADGFEIDRALDLSTFTAVVHDDSAGIVQGNGTAAGWYARNHGRLLLPAIPVESGSEESYNWGESPDDDQLDLVNSLQLAFQQTGTGGAVSIELLAPDRDDLPDLAALEPVGLWGFHTPDDFAFGSAELTFRYDDGLAASLGLSEADLSVYQFADEKWIDVTGNVDTARHSIYADGLTSLSLFAVGAVVSTPVLTSHASGNWNTAGTWDDGTVVPDQGIKTAVGPHTVTVSADAAAASLSLNHPEGALLIDRAVTLSVAGDVELAAGRLSIAPAGRLDVDGNVTLSAAEYASELDGPEGGLIAAAGSADLGTGSTLSLRAIGGLGPPGRQTRTILAAGEGLTGSFAGEPAQGDHLGYGVFHRAVEYDSNGIDVDLFQAAAGDSNGDGLIDNADLQSILAAGSFGAGEGFDWPQGDFDGNGQVDNADLQLILATGLFGTGPYAATAATVPEPSTAALLFTAMVATLATAGWQRRSIG